MTPEKNVPLSTQTGQTFHLLKEVEHTRVRLAQKMDTEKAQSGEPDSGDVYFHTGLAAIEALSNQVLNLQCWIKDNVVPNIPIQTDASTFNTNSAAKGSSALSNVLEFIKHYPWWAIVIFFVLCAGVGEVVYIANHGISFELIKRLVD